MGWADEGLTKSRNQLLEEVHRRGEQLRARRRNVGLAVAAPVLLLAFLVPATLGGDGGRPTTVAASSPPGQPSSSTSALPPLVLAAEPSTTVADPARPRPYRRCDDRGRARHHRGPGHHDHPGRAATKPAPSTTTTSPPPTTLDPSVAPGPTCNRPKFTTSAQTDKPSYRAGETVRPPPRGATPAERRAGSATATGGNWVEDANGQAVTAKAWPPFNHGEWRPFAPGESMARTWEWVAAGPPNRYRVVFDYEPFAEPTASFEIVAG